MRHLLLLSGRLRLKDPIAARHIHFEPDHFFEEVVEPDYFFEEVVEPDYFFEEVVEPDYFFEEVVGFEEKVKVNEGAALTRAAGSPALRLSSMRPTRGGPREPSKPVAIAGE